MAVSTTNNRISYTGNGVTTAFSFPYKFLLSADLVVVKRLISTGAETPQTLTTHYTVTGAGAANGGTVTMLAAPSSLYELVIYNEPDLTQEVDLVENDSSPAEVQEGALDKLTIITQRLHDVDTRSVRLSDGFAPTFDPVLPVDLDLNPGATLVVNDDGDGIALGPTVEDIESTAASAAEAAASASDAADDAAAAAASASDAAASASAAGTSEGNAAASEAAAAATLANVIPKAIVDAAGDMIVATADNTPAKFDAPTIDGYLLTADTAMAKKMKWAAFANMGMSGNGISTPAYPYTLLVGDDGKTFKVDTSAGAKTITAHAAAANFKFTVVDVGGALNTNALTFVRNGSQKINGISGNFACEANYGRYTFMFDGTDWWQVAD